MMSVPEPETPPRMRGRRLSTYACRPCSGNTPAYAGKTVKAFETVPVIRKHPRVCGEDRTKKEKSSR